MQSLMEVGNPQEQGGKPLEQEDRAHWKEDNLLVHQQDNHLERVDSQAEEDSLRAVLGSLGAGMQGSLSLRLDIQVLELGSLPQVLLGIHLQGHRGIQELLHELSMLLQVPDMLLHLQLALLPHVWSHCELPSLQRAFPSSRLQAEMLNFRSEKNGSKEPAMEHLQ